jgi:hypothetical protein
MAMVACMSCLSQANYSASSTFSQPGHSNGLFETTFARVVCTHSIKKAGFSCTKVGAGAVTLIQRFASALNLKVHFHVLFFDGVYVDSANASGSRFR